MKTIFLLILFPCLSYAGPYYEVVNSTTAGTSTMTISGYIGVAASSTTPTTYKFRIDGPGGYIQFPDGTTQTTASGGDAVLAATQTFTGGNIFQQSSTFSATVNLPTRDKIIFGNTLSNSSSTNNAGFNTTATSGNACVTGSTLTITTQTNSRIRFNGISIIELDVSGGIVYAGLVIDGVATGSLYGQTANVSTRYSLNISYETEILSSGSHSVCAWARTSAGTLYFPATGTTQLSIMEIR